MAGWLFEKTVLLCVGVAVGIVLWETAAFSATTLACVSCAAVEIVITEVAGAVWDGVRFVFRFYSVYSMFKIRSKKSLMKGCD